jgi:tRNA U34 5-methylaminomethyl-2-thiouridine-forming methyltransferase MnmC
MALHPELEIFTTADGSPTLSFRRSDGYIEKMHHTGGALTESLYIYHHGLKKALEAGFPAKVISVGLGLAYNELITLAEFMKREVRGKIWSFETMPFLRESFESWADGHAPTEYAALLDDIALRLEAHFEISDLRGRAKQALASGELELRGPFPGDAVRVDSAAVIFYDAFSNKMTPELWNETELRNILEPLIGEQVVLCTYAQTGALKRVLKALSFQLEKRPNFRGKRGSTLAVKNLKL